MATKPKLTRAPPRRISAPGVEEAFTGLFIPTDSSDDPASRVMAEIVELGLERNAWELDSLGYTVVTPDQVAAGGLAHALREKLLDDVQLQLGFRPDLERDVGIAAKATAIGRGVHIPRVLFRDEIYEKALMNRALLALITYLLGESCILSGSSAMLKVRAQERLELHSDQTGQPSPLPPYAQTANATWVLSDYSEANGATCFVPCSHKLCRHPNAAESVDPSLAVTVAAPAGSIVIWHGNTWHGAVPRTNPGGRLSLIFLFVRWYLKPHLPFGQEVSAEMLARNPDRFATLMDKRSPFAGQYSDGTKVDFTQGQVSQFA
jgi:hypothetical protein